MTSKRILLAVLAAIVGFGLYWSMTSRDEAAMAYAEAMEVTKRREMEKLEAGADKVSANAKPADGKLESQNVGGETSGSGITAVPAADSAATTSGPLTVRPAIPEFPDISWDDTRGWNLPLNNPPIAQAAQALSMDPDEPVIGVLLGKRARAYPWAVLANYHAINDKIGSKHVIVNLCEACNGGSAFLAKTEHATIDFRPCGLKNGTWYAVDFQTGSLWYPFVGEAFEGPLKGTKLTRMRTYFSTWRQWVRDHPETTVVLSNEEVRNRAHGRTSHMADKGTLAPNILEKLAKPQPNPKLNLLPMYELVFGLIPAGDDPPLAFEIDRLSRSDSLVQLSMGETPIVLFVRNDFQVGAYERIVDGKEVSLKVLTQEPFVMEDQNGNQWDEWGRLIDGSTYQAELPVADGYLTKWYEWLDNFPNTNIKTPADYADVQTQ